ncbi:hypothetical protein QAD02_017973 [Eretmocerus hayati]|uniref:Uncharacterized protein n=1 Tax=Eretmocerus hayati TaxID=131215 RepID=A0ACC2PH81_9HYME|nr:hypothetical protein QAD02_017973 [Eretmocerus hayati]
METHLDQRDFICKNCGKAFKRGKDLKRHMVTHGPKKLFPCEVCEKKFSRQDSMKAHLRREHKIYQPAFTKNIFDCKVCGSRFGRKAELTKHKQIRCCYQMSTNNTSGAIKLEDKEFVLGTIRSEMEPREESLIEFEAKIEIPKEFVKLEQLQ